MTKSGIDLNAYPLSWPIGRPRTKYPRPARFYAGSSKVTIYVALQRLRKELRIIGADNLVISTNVPTRRDGLPYASVKEPTDHGIAVYFRLKAEMHCLPCDKWDRVADNLNAVARHVGAVRGQNRWGVGDLAQAFAGHRALPPMGAPKPWWEALGFGEPPKQIAEAETRWRDLLRRYHPDHGGSNDQAADINAAWRDAKIFYNYDGA